MQSSVIFATYKGSVVISWIVQTRTFSFSNKSDWAASWSSFQSLASSASRFIFRFPLKFTQFADSMEHLPVT